MARYSEKRRAALEATMQDEVHRVAAEILRAEGLAALSMDRIAREIGVSRGTLYNYFADADSVLNFVEARTVEPILAAVEELAAGGAAPDEQLAAVARTLLGGLYDDRALAMALFAKQELHGSRAKQKVAHRDRFLNVVTDIMRSGIEAGALREVPPRLAAEVFLGAIAGLIDMMMYSGEFKPADELVPGLMDVIVGGLQPRPDATG